MICHRAVTQMLHSRRFWAENGVDLPIFALQIVKVCVVRREHQSSNDIPAIKKARNRVFLNLGFGEPLFCTLDSRGFRHLRAFRHFCKSSNQLPCCGCLSCRRHFRHFRDSRRFREKHQIAKYRFAKPRFRIPEERAILECALILIQLPLLVSACLATGDRIFGTPTLSQNVFCDPVLVLGHRLMV